MKKILFIYSFLLFQISENFLLCIKIRLKPQEVFFFDFPSILLLYLFHPEEKNLEEIGKKKWQKILRPPNHV